MPGGVIYLDDISTPHDHGKAGPILNKFGGLRKGATFKLDKVVLGTTKWIQLENVEEREKEVEERKREEKREKELYELYWNSMKNEGMKVERFLGDQDSAWKIVSVLLDRAARNKTPAVSCSMIVAWRFH